MPYRENFGDFVALFLRKFDGLAEFAGPLAFVVVAVRARRQIPPRPIAIDPAAISASPAMTTSLLWPPPSR